MSRTTTVFLDVLPAAHGDALVVEYGDGADRYRVLVDGGPASSYEKGLRRYLRGLSPAERAFELFVVSHIDTDHIDGALLLLRDPELAPRFGDIWFNGWEHVDRGGRQGTFLDALLQGKPRNRAEDGGAIEVTDRGGLRRYTLRGGAVLTILSPTRAKLAALASEWQEACEDAGLDPDDLEAVAARLTSGKDYRPKPSRRPTRGGKAADASFGDDGAAANGSSIAFLFEVGDRSILFAADAHSPVLAGSLRRLRRGKPVEVDVFKLSHHGSMANIDETLLGLVDCQRFVVSTSGAYFGHPDPETVELIARLRPGSTVYFNYDSKTTRAWKDPAALQRLGIAAQFAEPGEPLRITV